MKISVISIAKKEKSIYDPLYKDLFKMISRFAELDDRELFTKDVLKSHTISPIASQKAYSKLLEPYICKDYNIILHPDAKELDSFEFSELLRDKMSVKFFIGGAYGFEEEFLKKGTKIISLSKLTMSHKIVKGVLLEQIYRALSILHKHPYHK